MRAWKQSIVVGVVVALLFTALAWGADTTPLMIRQLNSLVRDGVVPDSPVYGLMLSGWTGTQSQFLSVNASGELAVTGSGAFDTELPAAEAMSDTAIAITDSMPYLAAPLFASDGTNFVRLRNLVPADNLSTPSTGYLSTTSFIQLFDGSTFDRLQGAVTNADDVAEITTSGAIPAAAYLFGYESVGDVWDRVGIDTARNLMVSLGTALDSTNDSVTAVGQFTDGGTGFTQETSKVLAIGGIFDDTVGTALAENDIASIRINSLRAVVFSLESGATRGLYTEVLTAGADDTANTVNGVFAYATLMAWDGTDIDRLSSFSDAGDVTIGDGTDDGLLGVFSSSRVYNVQGAGWDRETLGMATGSYTPGTNINVAATTSEVCTTDNVLTVGAVYIIQTEGTAFCELGADAATIVSATTDTPLFNPVQYRWLVASTSFDTLCCITAAGTVQVDLFPATF